MNYTLPPLAYEYNALEPYIDSRTMEIHHTKHHQGYINNLNNVLEKYPQLEGKKLEDLLENLDSQPFNEADKTAFRNNAGGHLNHSFFWTIMSKIKNTDEKLAADIKKKFGLIEDFKAEFTKTAMTRFGSGWAWLVKTDNGQMEIYSTPNQDSPYLKGHTPLIGLDVWEHAYYLKYQNKRDEYVKNWWNILKFI